MSQQPSDWNWDENIGRWYRLSHRNGRYVHEFEDGTYRTPPVATPSSEPRNPPDQDYYQSPTYGQSPPGPSSRYTHTSHQRRPSNVDQLTTQTQQPSIRAPSQSSVRTPYQNYQNPGQSTVQTPYRNNQGRSQSFVQALYQNYQSGPDGNGVQSASVNGPKTAITDPALQRKGVTAHKKLLGTEGEAERLDPAFRMRPKSFYRVGRVFLTLWSEPTMSREETTDVTSVRFNERVYTKVRRFVVVRASEQYCSAIPILTYTGQGVGKKGVRKSEHAPVYTEEPPHPPRPVEQPVAGEAGMMAPLRIVPDQPGDRLDQMSRAHHGKVYTIEENLKVKPFGMVQNPRLLIEQFFQVWNMGHGANTNVTPVGRPPVAGPSNQSLLGRALAPGSPPTAGTSAVTQAQQQARQRVIADYQAARIRADQEQADDSDFEDEDDETAGRAIPRRTRRISISTASAPATASGSAIVMTSAEATSAYQAYQRLVQGGLTGEQAFSSLVERLQQTHRLSRETATARARALVEHGRRIASSSGQQR